MSNHTRNFFKQEMPYDVCGSKAFFELVANSGMTVKNIRYQPDELNGSRIGSRLDITKIQNITFINVNFSKTYIHSLNFQNCNFKECFFINCNIKHCEFHNCKFINTNTHKIEFFRVYIDPNSFKDCLLPKRHQNIGTHLYQRLMQNSNAENQREFGRQASFDFNTWKRRQSFYDFKENWRKGKRCVSIDHLFDAAWRWTWGLCGAGVRIRRFVGLFVFFLVLFSIINLQFREIFGLNNINNCIDSLYFTVITMTTIGYGDITPTNSVGKVIVAVEGLIGFFLFALAASIAIRRIGP